MDAWLKPSRVCIIASLIDYALDMSQIYEIMFRIMHIFYQCNSSTVELYETYIHVQLPFQSHVIMAWTILNRIDVRKISVVSICSVP